MKTEAVATTVEVLGKVYQFKCPEQDVIPLQQAARYLEEKMRVVREAGHALSVDRLAVIAAINIAHQYLTYEQTKELDILAANERLRHLPHKIEEALARQAQLEL